MTLQQKDLPMTLNISSNAFESAMDNTDLGKRQ